MFTHSKTSKKSDLQMSLLPTSGREDSLARTSQWHAWARELGLKGKDRDSFLNLLDYLNNASPEFLSSRTFRAFSLVTEGGTSKSLFERWPASGMVWDGVCLTAGTLECPSHGKESMLSVAIETGEVPGKILFESECRARNTTSSDPNGEKPISPFKESFGDPVEGPIVAGLAYCLYACSARHTGTDWSRNYVSYPQGKVRRLLPVECERLQGFPELWTVPDSTASEFEDSDEARYHALGNAVTVPVAEWLATRIRTYLVCAPEEKKKAVTSRSTTARETADSDEKPDPVAVVPLESFQHAVPVVEG